MLGDKMYGITLEINQRCNLQCEYCYLKEKNNSAMLMETAIRSIDHAFDNVRIHKDKKLVFDFVGGEALLDFELLKKIVEYIESVNKVYSYTVIYGLTTNGTLFTNDIVDWLARYNFNLKLSIDGDRQVTNMGRKMKNAEDVYANIINNWKYVDRYELLAKKPIQVTNVVTRENCRFYTKSFIHLIKELHIKNILTMYDINCKWNSAELKYVEEEIEASYIFFFIHIRAYPIYWNFITEVKKAVIPKRRFYSCGGGLIFLYIRTNGDLYACANAIQAGSKLGNIYSGYDKESIKNLKEINSINNAECLECKIYPYCSAKGCIYKSISENGTIDKPSKLLCWQQKFYYRFYHEHKEELDKLRRY